MMKSLIILPLAYSLCFLSVASADSNNPCESKMCMPCCDTVGHPNYGDCGPCDP